MSKQAGISEWAGILTPLHDSFLGCFLLAQKPTSPLFPEAVLLLLLSSLRNPDPLLVNVFPDRNPTKYDDGFRGRRREGERKQETRTWAPKLTPILFLSSRLSFPPGGAKFIIPLSLLPSFFSAQNWCGKCQSLLFPFLLPSF